MQDQAVDVRAGEELNLEQLTQYLLKHVPDFSHISAIRQFPGGFSNLTYLLETNLGEWVLRRPPKGAKIKSAHDMGREFRVLEKLQPIYGRIPAPIHLCEDESVIGSMFYLMEFIDGRVMWDAALPDMSHAERGELYDEMNRVLAALHSVDVDAVALLGTG